MSSIIPATYNQIIEDIKCIHVEPEYSIELIDQNIYDINDLYAAYAKNPILVYIRGEQLRYELKILANSA